MLRANLTSVVPPNFRKKFLHSIDTGSAYIVSL